MMARLVFGPCDDADHFDRFLRPPVEAGRWSVFSAHCPSWEAAAEGLAGGPPDALVLWPSYTSIPSWVWSVPVPVVVLAADANLLWHRYRHLLPLADLVLTDAPSAARLRRAGVEPVRVANLFGLDRHFRALIDEPACDRDLDLVFVGNVHPHVQGERLPWLGRVAALAQKHRVLVAGGVFGAEYRALLRRAKLVFNRSIRGECNLRAFEAAAAGAVLVQEAGNDEVPDYLQPGIEYAPYTDDDLEEVVERLLAADAERQSMAEAARERVRWLTFDALLQAGLGVGGKHWGEVKDRGRARLRTPPTLSLAGRLWQRAALAGPDADATLHHDLTAAGEHHGLGVLARTASEAEPHFRVAAATGNRVSALGQALALAEWGRREQALGVVRQVLAALEASPELTAVEADTVPYPVRFDGLRVGWERAGFDHPGDPVAQRREKARLLGGQAHALAAELSGSVSEWERAVGRCPEWPHRRAALGLALVGAGQVAEAITHLQRALAENPFDNATAQVLAGALVSVGRRDDADRLRAERRLLAQAAPKLVTELDLPMAAVELSPPGAASGEREWAGEERLPTEPVIAAPAGEVAPNSPAPIRDAEPASLVRSTPPSASSPKSRLVTLTAEAFATRFGTPSTVRALDGVTSQTQAILTLVMHLQPRRVLEVDATGGEMTGHLTAFTPPDAVVYALGAADLTDSLRCVEHFGTGHKLLLIPAAPHTFDFNRLAPLDFALLPADHPRTAAVYAALRPGGYLVWQGGEQVTSPAFPERLYRLAGTAVAFLVKGEGLGAAAGVDSGRIALAWDGEFDRLHSLAHLNRAICGELIARGHELALVPSPTRTIGATPRPLPAELTARLGRELPGVVQVRHRWPADFTPPAGSGPFVLMPPWEHGRIPRAWVEAILNTVDELWCYSRSMLRAFVASGVPESRLAVIPPGVDPEVFRPGLAPLPLPTDKRVKLLFVGGTISRKGFDALLAAYRRAFTRSDDVTLVVRPLGAETFYRAESAGEILRAAQSDPTGPEVLVLSEDLPDTELPRLYAACDALVLPYRGEGFGLTALEAMACGLPVVVTAGGPTDEFVPQSAGWRIPARLRYFAEESVRGEATVGRPWWLEPDPEALVAILKEVVGGAAERARRGVAARRAAVGWTWARTAAAIEDRVRVLRTRSPLRLQRRLATPVPAQPAIVPARAESLAAPAAFAPALTLRADEPHRIHSTPRPSGTELASVIILCCNELDVTRLCVASILAHTRRPYELVFVNNGSTDGTAAYLDTLVGEVGPERVTVIHNPDNRGYPAGVNQGLAAARGEYLVLLNNDVVVTPGWLDKLVRCARHDWPAVGLAGAVTNYAPPPQVVEPDYTDIAGLDDFAQRRAVGFAGQALEVGRLTGFCLLVRRAVFEAVGQLDEGFGLGFFDDDDLCLRARRAGFRLAVALDCYVHHFGSRTFRALGVDTARQLEENLARYRQKWGAEEAARYKTGVPPTPTLVTRMRREPVAIPAVPAGPPRVSLTMIVKNEEKHLPDCLASVRDLVDEAVVIDTGSTDRTREIARSFGCVVGEFPWIDHFAAARNAALEKATGSYAFWMDADDRLDAANRRKLKALFDSLPAGNAAFVMKCLCVGAGTGASAAGTAVDHVRLFRLHPAHRWTYRVHEQILPALRATGAEVSWADVVVRHVGYVDPAVRRRKLDRDLRLLRLDEAEQPNDPFTLFNLGSVYHELGDVRAAAEVLEKSLAGSHPKDSIVRKTYALLARCRYQGGDRRAAEEVCRQGRQHYPDDAELLFLAAGYAREGGDVGAAEGLYRRLIDGSEGPHFASVDTSLRAVKARHNLAVMLLDQNRLAEAEGVWRAVLTHDPHFFPAQVGLGEIAVKARNQPALERQVAALETMGEAGAAEAAILRARWKAEQGDHAGAVAVLEEAAQRLPGSLGVRVALSHIHIAANSPPEVLEPAFRNILALDPHNEQAKRNLEVLYRKTGRWLEGVIDGTQPPPAA